MKSTSKKERLSADALAAAERIAKKNNVPVDAVITAYRKAVSSKAKLDTRFLFLEK